MSKRLILSAVAAATLVAPGLAVPAAAFAQTAPAPEAAPAPAPAPGQEEEVSPEEAALEAAGTAFEADLNAMQAELMAAKTAAGADTAKANADADAIVAKYQPKADAFATQVEAFLAQHMDEVPEESRAEVQQGVATIRSVPSMIRMAVMSAPTGPELGADGSAD